MIEIIKEVIVEWDPIDLMEFAPSDEYDNECYLILNALNMQKTIGEIIYNVFKDSFGESFQESLSKCIEIGTVIENRIKT